MSKKVEPIDYQDEELHEELMAAFRVYFKANQTWLNTGTKRSAVRLRQALSEVRRICIERREIVRRWAVTKEAQLEERKARRKDQKQQAPKDNDAN
jgi:hypothetical protein